ncbi:hypothetical protein XENTR_v10000794 [Xenopus tropicalis]|nr:hypothetical protein XENTR_v10000794 [Xenopus tropicalis]
MCSNGNVLVRWWNGAAQMRKKGVGEIKASMLLKVYLIYLVAQRQGSGQKEQGNSVVVGSGERKIRHT